MNNYFISGSDCLECHPTCLTCNGVSSTNCITCVASKYFVSSNNSCVSCNANGYFISIDECLECHPTCLTCNGDLSTNCLTCSPGTYLSGSQCLECDPTCLTCNGPLSTNCLSCPPGSFFLSSNNSCIPCNVNGYFVSGTECLPCDSTCLTCNGPSSTDCITCAASTYLVPSNNSCVSCNVNSYFISGTQCLQCDSTCLTCNGASSSSCLSCKTGRYLENSTCLFFAQEIIDAAGDITGITSQMQYVASTVMPVMLVERSTSAMILVGFLADVGLYKYLNVPFPENFVSFCEKMDGFEPPNIFENMDSENGGDNPSSTIGKFEFWEVSATLLDNCSFAIAKELITLAIILGLNILVCLLKGFPKHSEAMRKFRTLFMWNVFLSYYLGDFPDLLLNSMIQLRENYVSSGYANFSFALAVIIVVIYALLAIYFLCILNKRQSQWQIAPDNSPHSKSTDTIQSDLIWRKIPDSLGILVEDFRENQRFARNYVLVMLLESFLQILVIFFFQESGLTQAILYIIIVLGFFLLSAWKRPYKSNLNQAIVLVNQGSKVVMGVFGVIFGINEKTQTISEDQINLLGLGLMILILVVVIINLAISFLILIKSFYETIKEKWISRRKKEHSKTKSSRSKEIETTKQNFVDEPSSTLKLPSSSHNLHASSNKQTHQHDHNSREGRFHLRFEPETPITVNEIHRPHDSKRITINHNFEENSIDEIQMS